MLLLLYEAIVVVAFRIQVTDNKCVCRALLHSQRKRGFLLYVYKVIVSSVVNVQSTKNVNIISPTLFYFFLVNCLKCLQIRGTSDSIE